TRMPGCVSLLTFFAQAKKVRRPAGRNWAIRQDGDGLAKASDAVKGARPGPREDVRRGIVAIAAMNSASLQFDAPDLTAKYWPNAIAESPVSIRRRMPRARRRETWARSEVRAWPAPSP